MNIVDFSIVDFKFSEDFEAAIESKQTAVQTALKAENDLRRIEIEAKQQIETAKADAESIRIQGEALKNNQGLVQLKFVEKWNGVLPYYMMGEATPLISLMNQ
jgi:regulator of protease activity HflC (stomatin/prohibitin superfamily)